MKYILLVCLYLSTSVVHAKEQQPFIHILGVVQDAGYPQMGCYLAHCLPGWEDKLKARSPVSLALVSPKQKEKFLFEATPDLPRQLYLLDNQVAPIDYKLSGVFLTHAHIGHYAGLMFFGHEAMGAKQVPVFAMPKMYQFLKDNGPWQQLVRYQNIDLHKMANQKVEQFGEVSVKPFVVPHRDEYSETVGYFIKGPNKSAVFIPDINKWQQWSVDIRDVVASVDYAFLDAAFFADGELPGRDMSKIPHPFVSETMALFDPLPAKERNKIWFIHMNHTNPLLNDNSNAYKQVVAAGYHVAKEGLSFPL